MPGSTSRLMHNKPALALLLLHDILVPPTVVTDTIGPMRHAAGLHPRKQARPWIPSWKGLERVSRGRCQWKVVS